MQAYVTGPAGPRVFFFFASLFHGFQCPLTNSGARICTTHLLGVGDVQLGKLPCFFRT